MNEFTKDELEYLVHNLKFKDVENCNSNLIHKIKAMIDNYCEDDWRIGGADCIVCTKCEKEIFYHA